MSFGRALFVVVRFALALAFLWALFVAVLVALVWIALAIWNAVL